MSEPRGEPLPAKEDERLFRQVNPNWIKEGRVTSQAFSPFPKDRKLLSVSLASRTTPDACYAHFTQTLGFPSEGVWYVTTVDCAQIELSAYWAPVEEPPERADDAHGAIDFRPVPDKAAKTKSKVLAAKAHAYGKIYPR